MAYERERGRTPTRVSNTMEGGRTRFGLPSGGHWIFREAHRNRFWVVVEDCLGHFSKAVRTGTLKASHGRMESDG